MKSDEEKMRESALVLAEWVKLKWEFGNYVPNEVMAAAKEIYKQRCSAGHDWTDHEPEGPTPALCKRCGALMPEPKE
jgi:hypothetical protein